MDDNWPFIFKACAIFFSFAAALLLIWFTVDYWSRLIGPEAAKPRVGDPAKDPAG